MAMVGFNFTKLHAEKTSALVKSIKVNHNILISNIRETPMSDPKQSLLRFHFTFEYHYEPGVGKIALEGELTELVEKQTAAKIMEEWTKNKKMPVEVMSRVLNTVYSRSNIQAILLSKEVGLPLPVKLPSLELGKAQVAPKTAEKPAPAKKK